MFLFFILKPGHQPHKLIEGDATVSILCQKRSFKKISKFSSEHLPGQFLPPTPGVLPQWEPNQMSASPALAKSHAVQNPKKNKQMIASPSVSESFSKLLTWPSSTVVMLPPPSLNRESLKSGL